ncbi:MAG: hypothetical protein FWF06_06110 [Symbiobacteriaceae bacterium]|nr:hypothetical protein [Symbiobacteriaceae bacterium]
MKRSQRRIFNRTPLTILWEAFLPLIFTLSIAALLFQSMEQAAQASNAEGLRLLTEAVQRAAVKCYAVEGSYPATLQDIIQRYGLVYDDDRYAVYYEVFASNMQPSITVIPLR